MMAAIKSKGHAISSAFVLGMIVATFGLLGVQHYGLGDASFTKFIFVPAVSRVQPLSGTTGTSVGTRIFNKEALSPQMMAPQTDERPQMDVQSRRDFLVGAGTATGWIAAGSFMASPSEALAASTFASSGPIAVLGASGRTGALCVLACLQRGIPVRALTRSGVWPPSFLEGQVDLDTYGSLLTVAACDVKDPSALSKAIQGCKGVIYAASASKQGGDARAIDNIGVLAAAKASIDAGVGRYVVISSTATTRPKSLGYLFTNVLGGIMDEKRKGEVSVENLYRSLDPSVGSSYIIVRPGGLEEPKKNEILGPSALEISQGDTLAGIVSRADLAEVCVELAASKQTGLVNTALELYYTDSVQPCEGRFKKLLKNGEAPRLHGGTYEELFQGVKSNIDYANV